MHNNVKISDQKQTFKNLATIQMDIKQLQVFD